jgi:hypothetical protein
MNLPTLTSRLHTAVLRFGANVRARVGASRAPDGKSSGFVTQYSYSDFCDIEYPAPAVKRGWLHLRSQIGAWDVARLIDRMGPNLWLSCHRPEEQAVRDAVQERPMVPTALAGFWGDAGFIELRLQSPADMEEQKRYRMRVFASSLGRAAALLTELRAGFLKDDAIAATTPRVALVNVSYGDLEVRRVALNETQLVPRAQIDLYYGDGARVWVDAWAARLAERRYGLTILSGDPGTGKTTLLRSASAWLSRSHAFYFMPASRFGEIDAGELVKFWVEENKHSKLRSVLVLEDAESILLRRAGDNREHVAALLNLTDGVMGDALGVQVVCTMNSDLEDLDPALLRPGRLMAQRVFRPLDEVAAARLAAHLGRVWSGEGLVPLAELFNPPDPALAVSNPPRRGRLGFSPTSAQ